MVNALGGYNLDLYNPSLSPAGRTKVYEKIASLEDMLDRWPDGNNDRYQ
jgi:hypothetical protein